MIPVDLSLPPKGWSLSLEMLSCSLPSTNSEITKKILNLLYLYQFCLKSFKLVNVVPNLLPICHNSVLNLLICHTRKVVLVYGSSDENIWLFMEEITGDSRKKDGSPNVVNLSMKVKKIGLVIKGGELPKKS